MPSTIAFLQNLNWTEVVIILVVFILLFGAKRLPDLARGVGKSIREFKKATSSVEEDIRSAMEDEPEESKKIKKENEGKSAPREESPREESPREEPTPTGEKTS